MSEQIWLVCGPRDWRDADVVKNTIWKMFNDAKHKPSMVVFGDATGVDGYVYDLCRDKKINYATFYADWETHGKKAGQLRNKQMIETCRPTLCIAFQREGMEMTKVTANCLRQCSDAGISGTIINLPDKHYRP
jgi:hypothetical protein